MVWFNWRLGEDMGCSEENRYNVWWTPPESHKAVRCSLGIGITLLGCLSGISGPVKVLLVTSQVKGHVPTHWLRGRWPRRRVSREGWPDVTVVTLLRQRAPGVRREWSSNLRRDKWRWKKHMWERWELAYAILVLLVIPRNIKIDSNRWCSPGVRMPIPLTSKVVIHLNMLYYKFMVLNTTCLDIPDLFLYNACHTHGGLLDLFHVISVTLMMILQEWWLEQLLNPTRVQ